MPVFFRRKPADPLASARLLCAYCISDYLAWERDPREGASPPPVNPAVTVLPATVEGQEGGAALCAVHLRPMLRIRRTLAERHDATGKPHAESWTRPVPRLTSELSLTPRKISEPSGKER